MKIWKKVVRYRNLHPYMPTAEIARKAGTSRQNATQILERRGLMTKVPRMRTISRCRICGEEVENSRIWHNEDCKFEFQYLRVTCSWCTISFYRHRDAIIKGHRNQYKGIYCKREHFYRARRTFSGSK